jgi:hypothetical protein
VFAGIVDATDVFANTYNATNAGGEFLAYDVGSPTTGHLVNAIAGTSGTDSVSNAYPKGLYSQQLTLNNQGSAPPAFSGAAVLYSTTAGRIRYLASTGENNILERGGINVATFTVGNTATFTVVSGDLLYKGTAASNQSSTFEIEISGAFHTGSVTNHQPWFALFMDGSQIGDAIELSAAALTVNAWFSYTIQFRLAVLASGAPGTCAVIGSGTVAQEAVVIGSNSTSYLVAGSTHASASFDSTANHTLTIYGKFDTTSTSQEMDTYITRTTFYS